MSAVRVLLADDNNLVRAGIRSLLENLSNVEVIGEAENGRDAVVLAKSLSPNIVLMDIAMTELNGFEATARITKNLPAVKVIILSMHDNAENIRQAFRAGASGYLPKDAATVELEFAIQAAASGKTYLSPDISRQVVDDYLGATADERYPLDVLTPRQREILQLVTEGKSTKEIAYLLDVSIKTVETHRAQLMERLKIHDVPGLVRYAMRVGLIPPG